MLGTAGGIVFRNWLVVSPLEGEVDSGEIMGPESLLDASTFGGWA